MYVLEMVCNESCNKPESRGFEAPNECRRAILHPPDLESCLVSALQCKRDHRPLRQPRKRLAPKEARVMEPRRRPLPGNCPNCGDPRFVAKPYPEESKCRNCGASFYGSDKPVFDPLVSVSIKLRSSQREKARQLGLNLSEFVREKLDESFPP